MERLKTMQPVVIVILVCLSLFQFIQINKMSKEISQLQYEVSEVDSKIDKINGNDFDNEIGKIKDRLANSEGRVEDIEQNIETLQKTVRSHELSILDLEGRFLYRSPY